MSSSFIFQFLILNSQFFIYQPHILQRRSAGKQRKILCTGAFLFKKKGWNTALFQSNKMLFL